MRRTENIRRAVSVARSCRSYAAHPWWRLFDRFLLGQSAALRNTLLKRTNSIEIFKPPTEGQPASAAPSESTERTTRLPRPSRARPRSAGRVVPSPHALLAASP